MTEPFQPPGEPWHPVSPRMATARRVVLALLAAPVLIALLAVLLLADQSAVRTIAGMAVAGVVAVSVWLAWLIGRQVAAYGFAEREDDLLVTSGVLFRRLVIVPYGRMQLVDLAAGPIDRLFGITTVQLHTAAATTDASIPGLTPEEAAGLRDRLARLGEQRSAGL